MKIFSALYEKTMQWSRHRHAPWYLGSLSFAESSFFPIPPDVMLAPMCLASPTRRWWLAFLTTITSVAGGVFGYMIGMFAFNYIQPIIAGGNYWDAYQQAVQWFDQWGFWAIVIAGFSPILYKILRSPPEFWPCRFSRLCLHSLSGAVNGFFMVAALMSWGGARMESMLKQYVDRIGWATVALLVFALLIHYL